MTARITRTTTNEPTTATRPLGRPRPDRTGGTDAPAAALERARVSAGGISGRGDTYVDDASRRGLGRRRCHGRRHDRWWRSGGLWGGGRVEEPDRLGSRGRSRGAGRGSPGRPPARTLRCARSATGGRAGIDGRCRGRPDGRRRWRDGLLELGDGRVDRQTRRCRDRPGGRVGRDDREHAVAFETLSRQQPEVDPRGGQSRARRQDEGDLGVGGRPDPRGGGGDLVVDVEVDDRGHRARPSSRGGRAGGRRRGDSRSTGARSPGGPDRAASRPAGRPGASSRRRSRRPDRAT